MVTTKLLDAKMLCFAVFGVLFCERFYEVTFCQHCSDGIVVLFCFMEAKTVPFTGLSMGFPSCSIGPRNRKNEILKNLPTYFIKNSMGFMCTEIVQN